MLKVSILGLLCLIVSHSSTSLGMDSIPKCLKSGRLWGAVALAAVVSGSIYCIEYWQDAPNRDLFQGVCEGDAQKVAHALYDGAQHDRRAKDGSTLLHYAVRRGHHAIVPLLTAPSSPLGSLINMEDVAGNTPLYYALEKNDKRMCQLLCRVGASRICTRNMTEGLYAKIDDFNRPGENT